MGKDEKVLTVEEKLEVLRSQNLKLLSGYNHVLDVLNRLMNSLGIAIDEKPEGTTFNIIAPIEGRPTGFLTKIFVELGALKKPESKIIVPNLHSIK